MKKCPACGASVKLENLERHVRNQHPREDVDLSATVTETERRQAVRSAAPRRRKVTPGGFRIVLIVAAIVAIILAVAIINPFRSRVQVGEVAPDFTLTTSTGEVFTLSDTRGTPVLLEFMDVDCGYCQQEAEFVLRFVYANYSGGVRFVSVSADFKDDPDTDERLEQFKERRHTPWTYMRDEGQRVSSRYGAPPTPLAFILDREGVVVERIEGMAPDGYARYAAALDRVL